MIRRIIWYGESILLTASEDVIEINEDIKTLVADMFDTMRSQNGIGLAAIQIGVPKRIIVLSIPDNEDSDQPKYKDCTLINPEIIEHSEETILSEEGCLSFPEIRVDVKRYRQMKVQYKDIDGQEQILIGRGLLARALQHEIDHTNGIIFIDKIEEHHKKRMKTELRTLRKEALKRVKRYEKN